MNPVKQLVDKLNTYRDAYFNENKNLISDREYDALYDQLEELEKETGIIYADSPIHTVGFRVRKEQKKVKHSHPMLSLAKTKSVEDLQKFYGGRDCILSLKMDGLSVLLTYDNGKLIKAETRGDGVYGTDVTEVAKTFINLPLVIPEKNRFEIEGECIITDYDFEAINNELPEDQRYANSRNLASGSLNQLDPGVAMERRLRFIAWKVPGYMNPSMADSLSYAMDLGFEVVPWTWISRLRKPDWEKELEELRIDAATKEYPYDGMVLSYDDTDYGASLGVTSHHPKHSVAFKEYNEEYETTLREIEWNTTRTGAVNPVAIFDPVDIDGSTISRASLHNVSVIQELEIGIGDTIGIIKANEVIPKVESNYTRSNTYKLPDRCPACGYPLIVKADNGRKTLVCRNEKCSAKLLDKMANFVSRKSMDIRGLSEDRLKVLIEKEYITEFVDFYTLYQYRYELEQLPRWGDKLINNILDEVNKSKKQSLDKVLVAIGLPNVGVATAKTIAKFINNHHVEDENTLFDEFFECCVQAQDWSKLDDIGETMSKSINRYVSDNYSELWKLSLELTPPVEISDIEEQKSLDGKIFCITGTLDLFSNRNALAADIESRGGKVVGSVSKNTNYLICNDKNSGSSKTQKANKFGVPIISEQEYVEIMCKDGKFNR